MLGQDITDIMRWLKGLARPVAVMACNDVHGLHLLDACERAGVLVPEEVSVVGVDNEEVVCELCNPPLSSAEPNSECIGYAAAELLDQLMAENRPKQKRIFIDPLRVVVRQSIEILAVGDRVVAAAMRFIREQAVHGCTVSDVIKHVRVSPNTSTARRKPKSGPSRSAVSSNS